MNRAALASKAINTARAVAAVVIAGGLACGGSPSAPSALSTGSAPPTLPPGASTGIAGHWRGTTAQGASIGFTVSPTGMLTEFSVGYAFNGCAGTVPISDFTLSPTTAAQGFVVSTGSPGAGPFTQVGGLFGPSGHAQGSVLFRDYPGCGTAMSVAWSATRQ